jgi:hypothetical protein
MMIVGVLAIWRGSDHERMAVTGLLGAWALSMVAFRARSEDTQWAILAIDSSLFALYVWIAMRSRRFWPLFVAGFELLALITHVAHALDGQVSGWAYWTAERIWSYLGLVTIGYACWTAPHFPETTADPAKPSGTTLR